MDISGQWRGRAGLVTRGADGKVIFLYGEVQPSVVCSPLQVCDIELDGGEIVRDVLVGDTVRWKVEPATSGATGEPGDPPHRQADRVRPRHLHGGDDLTAHLPHPAQVTPDAIHGPGRL